MPLRFQIVAVAVLAALLTGGWWWLAGGWSSSDASGGNPKVSKSPAVPVIVEPLKLASDRIIVRAIGTGRAVRSAIIHMSVSGQVVEVFFAAEQRVKEGQPLLRLDDNHQRLAVRLAEVSVNEARRHSKRLGKLALKGAVSQARLQTARADLKSADLRLAQAKADLADRTIHAPFDGVVGLTDLDRGDRVTEDTVVTTLDDRNDILVEFVLPEDYAGGIRLGDPVTIKTWSLPRREIAGIVTALDSRIDETTRTLTVQAQIPNSDDSIRPGSSFEVQFELTGGRYPKVREVAVSWSRDGAYLWRVIEGKAEKVFVKLIRRERGYLLVEGPLRERDLIVVEGVQGLRPGQQVKTTPFKENSAKSDKRFATGAAA